MPTKFKPIEITRRRRQSARDLAVQSDTRLAVSRHEAAGALGCSVQHIDDLVTAGKLTKFAIGDRRVAILWSSLVGFVAEKVS